MHPATALLTKNNPYGLLALLNHPGQDYTILQKIAKKVKWPNTSEMYGSSQLPSTILVDKHPKHFVDVIETNLAVSYQTIAQNNVIVGTYKLMKDRLFLR